MQRDRFSYGRFEKINQNRTITTICPYTVITDRYGNDSYGYDIVPELADEDGNILTDSDMEILLLADKATRQINVMWLPLNSEVEIAEYGERINEMMQAVLYTDESIKEKDRLLIGNTFYTVVSIKKYPSYRLIIAERVR